MAKFCANGHQMEDSWEVCPYCQRTGFQTGGGSPAAKTRLEGAPPAGESAGGAGRKTVLLTDKHKPPVVGWLVAISGDQKGEDFRIRDGQNIIGSAADSDVVLRDTAVSGKHASLRHKDQKFYLTDLDSTNGTYLNDGTEPIAREELKDNDMVRIGEVSLKFKCL
ncbi:MAG TPA: FHA domain-containing protein [Bryobacteraceae bacterium]|nr:FHA domain-containing protein [Bryobacteraceae bacterium]